MHKKVFLLQTRVNSSGAMQHSITYLLQTHPYIWSTARTSWHIKKSVTAGAEWTAALKFDGRVLIVYASRVGAPRKYSEKQVKKKQKQQQRQRVDGRTGAWLATNHGCRRRCWAPLLACSHASIQWFVFGIAIKYVQKKCCTICRVY